MRRLVLAGLAALLIAPAVAQTPNTGGPTSQSNIAIIAPTAAPSDNSNRIATTAWVRANSGTQGLPNGNIFIGNASNLATPQVVSGDATLAAGGALTLATVNSNVGTFGSATQCVTVTNNAKGLTTAVSAATCTPAIGSITGLGAGVASALGIDANTSGGFVTQPVGNASLATMAALTVKGNATNATAAPSDISTTSGSNFPLRENGSGVLSFGPLNGGFALNNNSTPLAKLANGTANTVIGATAAGAHADLAVPSCSAGGQGLQWLSGTGFQCTTISPALSSITGLGSGVSTALGTNVGTAGAFVVNGGAGGTPSSMTLTNATGLPLSGHTAQAAFTFVGNNTGSSASPTAVDIAALTAKASPASSDLVMISDQAASGAWKKVTVSSLASAGSVASVGGLTGAVGVANGIEVSGSNIQISAARRTLPTTQHFTSSSGTYTTPANVLWIRVRLVGGGGGGQGSGTSAGAGGNGGATCWNTSGAACTTPVSSATGGAGSSGAASAGGSWTGSCGLVAVNGGSGQGNANVQSQGGMGGASTLGGNGAGAQFANTSGPVSGQTNTGGGGGGATASTGNISGGGGGAGGTCAFIITSPAASYTYAVGAAGAAGTAGGSGAAGGAGGSGDILVEEFYN